MNKPIEQSLRDGDPQAYEQLFENYAPELLRLGYVILADATETEDMVQEVLIRFIESVQSGRFQSGNGTVRPYLRKSVRNRCIDHIRKQKHFCYPIDDEVIATGDALVEPSLQPPQVLDEKRMLDLIETGIMKLPALQRTVLVMRISDNLPYKTIAEELHISVDYVKNTLARARKRLRNVINSVMKG